MLLITFPDPVHEEVLIEAFWPDHPVDKARAALQSSIRDLRRALDPHHEPRGRSYLAYDEEHYSLVLPESSSCDDWEFRKAAQRALARAAPKGTLGVEEERALLEALPLFGGELLPEQRYESFVQEHRERLHKLFLHASLLLARNLNHAGHHARAIEIIDRGMKLDPLWGEGVEEMMRARAGNGELCRALRVYREYERHLQDALDLPPDLEMKRLFENLTALPAN
jgi:DNA-binding SARP family transcriptional activator